MRAIIHNPRRCDKVQGDMTGMGAYARISDTEGNVLGLFESQ